MPDGYFDNPDNHKEKITPPKSTTPIGCLSIGVFLMLIIAEIGYIVLRCIQAAHGQ